MLRCVREYQVSAFRFAGSATAGKLMTAITDEVQARRARVHFTAFGLVNHAQPEAFARNRQSGLLSLFFGVESGSQAMLDRMNKLVNVAEMRRSSSIEAGRHLHRGEPDLPAARQKPTRRGRRRWRCWKRCAPIRCSSLPGAGAGNRVVEREREVRHPPERGLRGAHSSASSSKRSSAGSVGVAGMPVDGKTCAPSSGSAARKFDRSNAWACSPCSATTWC